MDFDDLTALREHSAAWRLLCATNAPLVLGFLGRVFITENARAMPAAELASRLDDELYALRERLGEDRFPKTPRAYLDDWASPESGWLRKYYPLDSDEAHFDITPSVEKVYSWLESLRERSFVGTESRLNTVFELLRQMVYGTEEDPEIRLTELRRRRDEIDREIADVKRGHVVVLDATSQRDRYQQLASTARELLADFREVEANFRDLDRGLRERIAGWDGSKGALLDEVLGDRDAIADSDQGKSFRAFYDFLLSPRRQEELTDLLDRVRALEAIEDTDPRMWRVHYDWLDACERTQATVRLLSDQLRRFLDDQAWLENRRVMDLLHDIESNALQVRPYGSPDLAFDIEGTRPEITLPMERPLYVRPARTSIDSRIETGEEELDPSALFHQVFVDRARLAANVRRALQPTAQVGLVAVLEEQPLEQGLAELIGYLSLSDEAFEVVFDERSPERVRWTDEYGDARVASVPRVTFVRTGVPEVSAS